MGARGCSVRERPLKPWGKGDTERAKPIPSLKVAIRLQGHLSKQERALGCLCLACDDKSASKPHITKRKDRAVTRNKRHLAGIEGKRGSGREAESLPELQEEGKGMVAWK